MAQLIDGKALAKTVRAEVKTRAEAFRAKHNRAPGLDVVLVGDDPASNQYTFYQPNSDLAWCTILTNEITDNTAGKNLDSTYLVGVGSQPYTTF